MLLSSGKKIAFYYDGTCVGYEMDIKDESGVPQPVRDLLQRISGWSFPGGGGAHSEWECYCRLFILVGEWI